MEDCGVVKLDTIFQRSFLAFALAFGFVYLQLLGLANSSFDGFSNDHVPELGVAARPVVVAAVAEEVLAWLGVRCFVAPVVDIGMTVLREGCLKDERERYDENYEN